MQFVPIQDIPLINEIPVLELIVTFLLVLYSNSTFGLKSAVNRKELKRQLGAQ